MNKNQKLAKLKSLLKQKQSKKFYANRLNVSVEEIDSLMQELNVPKNYIKHDMESDVMYINTYYTYAPTPEQVIADHNIDESKYKLSSFWSKQKDKGYQVSAQIKRISDSSFDPTKFTTFLESYKSPHKVVVKEKNVNRIKSCFIFNKQDSHLNKFDIDGNNNIEERFSSLYNKCEKMLMKANLSSNVDKVLYIIGSDEFNSEYTNATTKGTPQVNVGQFHESFEAIADHEVKMINLLLSHSSNVEVVYCPGNHDEFVGWHLVSWLKAYFRQQNNLTFNSDPSYTKYIKYSNTAICINHGDAQKPERLAQNFPIDFKSEWSSCDHFYIFCGDKHTELSRSIGGITFYQIPAFSKSKSLWDSKNGYTNAKGELTAFLVEENEGIVDIYKSVI